MDFNAVCRTCLGSTNLIPIINKWSLMTTFSVTMLKITGYQIALNDKLPTNICAQCLESIKDSLMFRAECKKTENILLQALKEMEQNKLDDDFLNHENDIDNLKTAFNNGKNNDIIVKIENFDNNKNYSDNEDDIDNQIKIKENYSEIENNAEKIKLEYNKNTAIAPINNYINVIEDNTKKSKTTVSHYKIRKKRNTYISRDIQNQSDLNNSATNAQNDLQTNASLNVEMIGKETKKLEVDHEKCWKECSSDASKTLSIPEEPPENIKLIESQNKINSETDNKGRINCKICSKNLSVKSLRNHMVHKHSVKMKCEYCETYLKDDKLEEHIFKHHGPDCRRCKYCKQELETRFKLKNHIAACMLVTKCKKEKRKKYTTTVWSKQKVECDVCKKQMMRGSLGCHKKIQHAGLGPICDYCGKRFTNKGCIIRHMRAKHGSAKIKCSQCDFESATSAAMQNHERRHSGEKPFICEMCGTSFHAPYLLSQHKQLHRTERLFKCNLCPATFKRNNGLHTHRAMLHNIKRHTCALCPRAFNCRHYYVRHMRAVHHYYGVVPHVEQSA